MERLCCSLFPPSVCVIVLFVISLERHSIEHWTASSVGHIEKLQVGFARWKKKENPKMLIIFVCFLNLFRERKLIKVVFSMFPLFFFLPGSCESGGEKKLYFHCFFLLYIVNGGIGKRGE